MTRDAIDLRSDTVTTPSDAMRTAAADAAVGDDVYGEDPTVNELEATAAALVGKNAALFVPSGTMGNQVAAHVHTDPGNEVIAERASHVVKWELGGLAQHANLQVRMVEGTESGIPSPETLQESFVEQDLHRPGTGLVTLENTHNSYGGAVGSVDEMTAAAAVARDRGIPVHLDGARVFNAAAALDVPVTDLTDPVDTVMFCVSKGLGAPVGSILAGPVGFIERARRTRKLFGGAMRQAGMLAAPALLALENVDRLANDHANAKRLAAGLDALDGLSVSEPETNIVLVDTSDLGVTAATFLERCENVGVRGVPFGEHVARFCTHLDVTSEDVDVAIDRVETAFRE